MPGGTATCRPALEVITPAHAQHGGCDASSENREGRGEARRGERRGERRNEARTRRKKTRCDEDKAKENKADEDKADEEEVEEHEERGEYQGRHLKEPGRAGRVRVRVLRGRLRNQRDAHVGR